MKAQTLTQVYKITEYRDGAVYRTKSVGYAWVTLDTTPTQVGLDDRIIFSPPSTQMSVEFHTLRMVDDNSPDYVITSLEQLRDGRKGG